MTNQEMIKEALEEDIELSREEYAEKCARADYATAAHGIDGEAPLNEAERETRMRMNYYGISVNILMSILAGINGIEAGIATLNNNISTLMGGALIGDTNDTDTGAGA